MTLQEIVKALDLAVRTAHDRLGVEVTSGYVSDLLSDVMAHGPEGAVWVTLQTHQNIAAVASLKGLVGIILVNGREPEAQTLEKAEQERIPILVSRLPAFEVVGRLYTHGIVGTKEC